MKKRILCYTDFSENSQNAIHYAIKLYEQQACDFYILNAFQSDEDASDIEALIPKPGNETYELEKKISEAGLKKTVNTLKSNFKSAKHTYKTISSYNTLLYSLKSTIINNTINLLVISTQGMLDEEENNNIPTLDIMEYITECSILAVPCNYKYCGLKVIVLPVNYEEALNETNFSEILDIAKLHHPNINILHIKKEHELNDNQLEHKKILESILQGLKYSFHTLMRMNVNKGINLFINNDHCNLIAYIDERSHYIGNELPRPLFKALDNHLSIPVLLVNVNSSR
nr:universal stress protein [uncultured Psychroserpens sp.]